MNELLLEFLDSILQERGKPAKMRARRVKNSSAAEQAKSLGLERKPGFGNYGPRNSKKVTHRSVGGKLVPIGDTGMIGNRGVGFEKPEPAPLGKDVEKRLRTPQDQPDRSKAYVRGTSATPEEAPEYLKGRGMASDGVIGSKSELPVTGSFGATRTLHVRQILDEKGNPIDISTSDGRTAASSRLEEQIRELHDITLRALKDFPKNTPASQWVGTIGEMYALKELLDQDVEAYLATDSNPESDLITVDRNGPTGLKIVEISAKTTKEKGVVGVKGANARAIFSKMAEGKKATVAGIPDVAVKTAVNIVYDIREKLGNMLTDGMVVEVPGEKDRAIELSDEELAKCTPEYQTDYRNPDARSGGKSVRQNFALYERSRIIQKDDIDKLEAKMLEDVKGNKRKTDEEKETEAVIVQHYIQRLRASAVGKPLSELRQIMINDLGEIFDSTNPPTDLVVDSDLVVIRFNLQTGVPEVKIAKWEDVKNCIDDKEKKSREATVKNAFPDREVSPELADKQVGDAIDAECKRPDGTTKWRCQFMKYIGHSFPSQARLRSAKGNQPRRGRLQLKLNWSPPTNCLEDNLKNTADYVR